VVPLVGAPRGRRPALTRRRSWSTTRSSSGPGSSTFRWTMGRPCPSGAEALEPPGGSRRSHHPDVGMPLMSGLDVLRSSRTRHAAHPGAAALRVGRARAAACPRRRRLPGSPSARSCARRCWARWTDAGAGARPDGDGSRERARALEEIVSPAAGRRRGGDPATPALVVSRATPPTARPRPSSPVARRSAFRDAPCPGGDSRRPSAAGPGCQSSAASGAADAVGRAGAARPPPGDEPTPTMVRSSPTSADRRHGGLRSPTPATTCCAWWTARRAGGGRARSPTSSSSTMMPV
jgi:hypothetical protein